MTFSPTTQMAPITWLANRLYEAALQLRRKNRARQMVTTVRRA